MTPRADVAHAAPARLTRRNALQQLAATGALLGLPLAKTLAAPAPLPKAALLKNQPEEFWSRVRSDQFMLGDARVFLNPASLGALPKPVLETVIRSQQQNAEFNTDEVHRWGYETLDAERAEMAEFLGCRKEELAFTHNCTEAMSFLANGLELAAGDEVLITNQEHGGGTACWKLRAARSGIRVREVEIPVTPKQPEEITDRLISAIGPRTRVLSFSGITSPTGLILPAKQICQAAREKGLISVVDGAHMDGQIPVHLRDLECDYFAGSPHKWMFAPAGCGLLYGRDDRLDQIWPCVVASGWDNKDGLRAARFMMTGTNNRSIFDGMMAGLRFLKDLDPDAVYQRTHQLARLALDHAQKRDYLEVVTPDDSRFFHAMISLRFKSDQLAPLFAEFKRRNIYILHGQRIRLSTHIYARPRDIATFFDACDSVLGA